MSVTKIPTDIDCEMSSRIKEGEWQICRETDNDKMRVDNPKVIFFQVKVTKEHNLNPIYLCIKYASVYGGVIYVNNL